MSAYFYSKYYFVFVYGKCGTFARCVSPEECSSVMQVCIKMCVCVCEECKLHLWESVCNEGVQRDLWLFLPPVVWVLWLCGPQGKRPVFNVWERTIYLLIAVLLHPLSFFLFFLTNWILDSWTTGTAQKDQRKRLFLAVEWGWAVGDKLECVRLGGRGSVGWESAVRAHWLRRPKWLQWHHPVLAGGQRSRSPGGTKIEDNLSNNHVLCLETIKGTFVQWDSWK